MKFCFRAALAALLCLTLTACGSGAPAASADTPAGGGMMVVNPMQAKTSLEEVNAAIGCGMKAPAGIAVSDGSADTAVFDSGRWTRWFDGEMQYSLVSDETGTQDTATLYAVRDALR